jgi:hypothetical protein
VHVRTHTLRASRNQASSLRAQGRTASMAGIHHGRLSARTIALPLPLPAHSRSLRLAGRGRRDWGGERRQQRHLVFLRDRTGNAAPIRAHDACCRVLRSTRGSRQGGNGLVAGGPVVESRFPHGVVGHAGAGGDESSSVGFLHSAEVTGSFVLL